MPSATSENVQFEEQGADDGDWQERAACKGNPANFYPLENERGKKKLLRVAAAKAICNLCPVRSQCLEYALQRREPAGVWGGLDAEERGRLLGPGAFTESDDEFEQSRV